MNLTTNKQTYKFTYFTLSLRICNLANVFNFTNFQFFTNNWVVLHKHCNFTWWFCFHRKKLSSSLSHRMNIVHSKCVSVHSGIFVSSVRSSEYSLQWNGARQVQLLEHTSSSTYLVVMPDQCCQLIVWKIAIFTSFIRTLSTNKHLISGLKISTFGNWDIVGNTAHGRRFV